MYLTTTSYCCKKCARCPAFPIAGRSAPYVRGCASVWARMPTGGATFDTPPRPQPRPPHFGLGSMGPLWPTSLRLHPGTLKTRTPPYISQLSRVCPRARGSSPTRPRRTWRKPLHPPHGPSISPSPSRPACTLHPGSFQSCRTSSYVPG